MRFGIRELVFLMLLLAMPVAGYLFVYEPRNTQYAAAREEIKVKQEKLRQLELATANINDLGSEIDHLTEAIALFEQKLPAGREVEVILKQVWELAAKNKLTPRSVRTDPPTKRAQFAEQPIKMVITGDFDDFYSFLLDLEKLNRITQLPVVKMKKMDSDDGQMQADIVLSIFYENAGVGSLASGERR